MNEASVTTSPIVITQYEELQNKVIIAKQGDKDKRFNYRDPKDNKLARSHVFSLRQIRGEIERARKSAKAYALDYGRRVDSAAAELEADVDALIKPHEDEIRKIEAEEKARVDAHKARIAGINGLKDSNGVQSIKQSLEVAKALVTDDLQEFKAEADSAILDVIRTLETKLAEEEKREAEAAELERLRREAAERAEADRIERIRQQAIEEERARKDAEERARIAKEAKEKAEREALAKAEEERKEREAREAIAAAERKELEAKMAKERAERAAEEANRRAKEAERREKERAEREAAEVKRIQESLAAAKKATEENCHNVASKIAASLDARGFDGDKITQLIVDGDIPHVRIDWINE